MKQDPLIFFDHIIESINLLEAYIEQESETSFRQSIQLQDSCIRRLEIIGEAVKNIPPNIKILSPEIPWKNIAGMRDMLIHEYFGVDIDLTWRVLTKELSPLKNKILELRKKL